MWIGKQRRTFFWITRRMYLGSKLYFERVEIFLWQFWHLCGGAALAAGRGSNDCTSRGQPGWPGPGEAEGPGLSGGHSGQASEASEREQLSVQPRQSARAERPSQTECHDQRHRVTRPVTLPSHSAQPLSRMSQWDPPEARWGGGQRSPVRPEDSPPYLWGSYSESVPCDPPGCQHLTSSSPLALLSPQERERAGVGPWQQCPWFPLGSHHSQSIADSDTGHWPADSSSRHLPPVNMHAEIQVALKFVISFLYNKLPRRWELQRSSNYLPQHTFTTHCRPGCDELRDLLNKQVVHWTSLHPAKMSWRTLLATVTVTVCEPLALSLCTQQN